MNTHPLRPTRDHLHTMAKQILRSPQRHWGENPFCGFLTHEPSYPHQLGRHPLPVPEELWVQAQRAYELLYAIAADPGFGNVPALGPSVENTVGLYLFSEAFHAPPKLADELKRRVLAGGSIPDLIHVPGSRSSRTLTIVTAAGDCYWASLFQGREEEAMEEMWGPAEQGNLVGLIFDSCERVLARYLNRAAVDRKGPNRHA